MLITDFLSLRETSLQARFTRQKLGAGGWQQFRETVAKEFHIRFRDPIECTRDAYIAIGARP